MTELTLTDIVFAEELHAHDGEDEDDDTQYKGQITQGTHGPAHDRDEQVERRPRLGQLEHSQLFNRHNGSTVNKFIHLFFAKNSMT